MKKTTTLKALVLSMIMVFGLVMPMTAQKSDGFFKNNDDYINRDAATGNITNQTFGQDPGTGVTGGITNQQFGVPVGSGLLIMVAAGAGYAIARRKRARKGMTLLLAAAMLLGMTQCKKNVETITSTHENGIRISLKVENGTRHHVITTGEPFPGDLGKVEFDDEDMLYVFNGGNIVGAMVYDADDEIFNGIIGVDVTEDEPYPPVALDPDDYLHFGFFGNAVLGMDEQGIYADISGQKRNLPVLSVGKTAELYGNYEAQGITDFSCVLENKCALVKFTFNGVTAEVGMALDDEVILSGVLTQARLDISNGVTVTPDLNSTGKIALYHASSGDANVRWAVMLPQNAVSDKNMLLRNWLYTGNVSIDAVAINEYKEVAVSCSGTHEQFDFFTVRQNKKSLFSPGNLQYKASTPTWRFAEHQWDVIGSDNMNISPTYTGWIDLFGFGTGNAPTETSTDEGDYATYYDWGDYCGDPTNNGYTWYAPNMAEWLCLINWRPNEDALDLGYQDDIRVNKGGPATVNGVKGYVLIPDYFEWPTAALEAAWHPRTYGDDSDWNTYTLNVYNETNWGLMAANGAIFLPGGGIRRYDKINDSYEWYYDNTGSRLFAYWAHNPYWKEYTANIFTVGYSNPGPEIRPRYTGASVRLMREFDF